MNPVESLPQPRPGPAPVAVLDPTLKAALEEQLEDDFEVLIGLLAFAFDGGQCALGLYEILNRGFVPPDLAQVCADATNDILDLASRH
jgi:hypothetical protein